MTQPISSIRDLSVAERIQLFADIWDSLVDEDPEALSLTPSQRKEVRERLAAHDKDPASALPWNLVRDSLFKQQH